MISFNIGFTGNSSTSPHIFNLSVFRQLTETSNKEFAAEHRVVGRRQSRRGRARAHRICHRKVFDKQKKLIWKRHRVVRDNTSASNSVPDPSRKIAGLLAETKNSESSCLVLVTTGPRARVSRRMCPRGETNHRRRRIRSSPKVVVRRIT